VIISIYDVTVYKTISGGQTNNGP